MTETTNPEITTETRIQRSETVLYSELSDEVAMMDIERGQYYGVYGVGSRIWLMLTSPMSIRDICQQLISEYDVSLDVCYEEVISFIRDLQEHDVVEVAA